MTMSRVRNAISTKLKDMSPALQLIFGVLVLVCRTGAVPSRPTDRVRDYPADCSVAGWSVPKPPDEAKLLQVQAIIRSVSVCVNHA